MKRTYSRAVLFFVGALTLLLCLGLFCACDGGKSPADTTVGGTPTDAPTEAPTAEPTDDATEAPTDPTDTETPTDEVTDEDTEPVTEAETLPADKPTSSAELTFCDSPLNTTFIEPNSAAEFSVVQDGEMGSVLKLTVADAKRIGDPYIKIDYAAYMDLAGLEPVAWNDCGYAVVLLKLEGVTNSKLEMAIYDKSGEKSKTARGEGSYKTAVGEWQYALIPLVDEAYDGHLTELRFDFTDKPTAAGETVYVKSITFVKDKVDAVRLMGTDLLNVGTATVVIPGLTEEFTFLHITDTHVSAFSDADIQSWTATRYSYNVARRNAFAADGLYAEERFPLLFDYADEIGADGLFLTGDLIDFPSEQNLALLYENATRTKATPIFCLGNHDWTYADDYMSAAAVQTYIPRFNDLTGGDPYFSYVEYDGFIVAAIDNSTDVVTQQTVDKFLSLYEKNKPIILLLHVPFHVDTLEASVRNAWGGRNITMGPGAMGSDWGSVQQLYNAVCVAEDTPVVAVFTGHVHFNHEDVFPNGVPQYVTSTGYTGDVRVVTVKGE